jgi:hypothetical protein
MTKDQLKHIEADFRAAVDKTPAALETFLEFHHIPMRIEFDGSNSTECVYSACLPGMKVTGLRLGKSPFIIAHCTTPATAVAALAKALEGKTLRTDDEFKRAEFPVLLDAQSLVEKLEPGTEVERLALSYVTDVAIRMVVPFSITREAYDNVWLATMGASMLQTELKRQLMVPISVENEYPLLAVKDIAWQLGGRLLHRREMEFQAPVLPNAHYTLQEEVRVGEKSSKDWTFAASIHPRRSGGSSIGVSRSTVT